MNCPVFTTSTQSDFRLCWFISSSRYHIYFQAALFFFFIQTTSRVCYTLSSPTRIKPFLGIPSICMWICVCPCSCVCALMPKQYLCLFPLFPMIFLFPCSITATHRLQKIVTTVYSHSVTGMWTLRMPHIQYCPSFYFSFIHSVWVAQVSVPAWPHHYQPVFTHDPVTAIAIPLI